MIVPEKYIDEIITYETEADLYVLLNRSDIDILVMGSDWEDIDNPIKDLVKEVCYHDRSIHNYSSTSLRKRIQEEENKRDGLI